MMCNESVVLDLSSKNSSEFPLILKKQHNKRKSFRRNCQQPLGENRIMSKRGRVNIHLNKIPDKSIRYVRDLFNTLVNMRWRWILFIVGLVNVAAYLTVASFFLFDAWFSGDFDDISDHKTCINGINKFTSFFMLGIETITTTGYGYIHPTENCRLVFFIMTISTLVTFFIDGAFISVVYVKFGRPTRTVGCNIFSKKAVITLRNGKLCLIIRINDRFGKHWIGSKINLYLVKDLLTPERELIPNFIQELTVKPHGMLFWPLYIVHEITSTSPLWDVSANDLMSSRFEILAVLSGNSIQTSQPSKSQTSYLSSEILWGYRFNPCLEYDSSKEDYTVNRKLFNLVLPYDTPLCSAHLLNSFQKELSKKRTSIDSLIPNPTI